MRHLFALLLVFAIYNVVAQPGRSDVRMNINELNENNVQTFRFNGHVDYTFVIDSTSDLAKLTYLRLFTSLKLIVLLKELPKEFSICSNSLRDIVIDGLSRLRDLSMLAQLKNLRTFTLYNYSGNDLPELGCLERLNDVSLYRCNWLKSLHGIANCRNLRLLRIIGNNQLNQLHLNWSNMNLVNLDISDCTAFDNIDELAKCRTLETLLISKLPLLKSLNSDMGKTSLHYCDITNCQSFESAKGLSRVKTIKYLVFEFLPAMKTLGLAMDKMNIDTLAMLGCRFKSTSEVAECTTIRELEIAYSDSLTSLNFDMSKMNLTSIDIKSCPALAEVKGLSTCLSLKNIVFEKLESLRDFDIQNQQIKLNCLAIRRCKNLEHTGLANRKYIDLAQWEYPYDIGIDIVSNDKLLKIFDFWIDTPAGARVIIAGNKSLKISNDYFKNTNRHWRVY